MSNEERAPIVKKVKYEVKGMTCGGCQRSVAGALTRAGVAVSVEDVSLAEGTVQVDVGALDDVVRRAIEDAGFEVGQRRAQ
jgi:copper chaperone CopZ